jgi:tol-pal system protein YbgF
MLRLFLLPALLITLAAPAAGQANKETLADIRQELSILAVDIQRLKQELSTTGVVTVAPSGSATHAQRLDALEGELRRLTGKVEELEFRIDKIVRDGTNRIGDLEFRLVELEGGDVSKLGETSTLGGEEVIRPAQPVDTTTSPTTEMAVSEQGDFERAMTAFQDGDFRASADLFQAFADTYPGGPLTADAHYWRGESLAELSEWSKAARAYLNAFSSAPDGDFAPRSLYRLGVSLDRIGQTNEACLTLREVGVRYPDSDANVEAIRELGRLDCSNL